MTSTLTISALTKRFQGVAALSDVSLTVAPGERVALIGHNGAGKTTLMKIILGLIPRDGGDIAVCGHAPGSAGARRLVAYLPENAAFHPALTGLEQIRLFLGLRGEDPAGAPALLDRVGLGPAARRRIGTYSKGMRQRIGLAQALIGQPRLLVLDEPTSGLDPVSRREFYGLLDGLAADGASILLSSHALTEVEARTDRILILSRGQRVAEGTLATLRRAAALPLHVQVQPRNGYASEVASALPGAVLVNDKVRLTCCEAEKLPLIHRITGLGNRVVDLEVLPPSLEDIYEHYSRREAS
ncbi:MAG: ABC transporter ATP-binding protein [Mangrovicoccus sp.]|jgi:Cu-processing system ATP-binding protein|nr:ABC transporter ATP-binding protein [Mangrovicoccus sp.]